MNPVQVGFTGGAVPEEGVGKEEGGYGETEDDGFTMPSSRDQVLLTELVGMAGCIWKGVFEK